MTSLALLGATGPTAWVASDTYAAAMATLGGMSSGEELACCLVLAGAQVFWCVKTSACVCRNVHTLVSTDIRVHHLPHPNISFVSFTLKRSL